MGHAPHHRELMHATSNQSQMLAQLNPRHGSPDRSKLTTNVRGSVGFGVPGIQVTYATPRE